MLKICNILILLGMLLCTMANADVQMSIGIGLPNVSIGISVPAYPEFVVVPGYPVYYAPRMNANFFFYDGLYWVYQDDNWYESTWYNGPWWLVDPEDVPLFVLRIPVRYYRMPPAYFIEWQSDSPPRWGDHWGRDWNQRRGGWDRWNRNSVPAAAPLPAYQRQFSGESYPKQVEQQREIHQQNYHFQPRDPAVRKQYQEQKNSKTPTQQGKSQQDMQKAPEDKGSKKQDSQRSESSRQESLQRSAPPRQDKPYTQHGQPKQNGDENVQSPTPTISQGNLGGQVRSQQLPQNVDSRSQSPKNGGVRVDKSTPAIPQQRRTEVQAPRQQSLQGKVQLEQQNAKQQSQNNNTPNEPKQQQRQEYNKGRNE
jgi:hypothetical protein